MLDYIRQTINAAPIQMTALCLLAIVACVPDRDRQEPAVGLSCTAQARCGADLVCYTWCEGPACYAEGGNMCQQPCARTNDCTIGAGATSCHPDGVCLP